VFARFRDIDGNVFRVVSFDEVTHALEAQRPPMQKKLESSVAWRKNRRWQKRLRRGFFRRLPP